MKGLLISGGSLSVLTILGHLSFLIDNHKLDLKDIRYWGGVSSGALASFLLMCGLCPSDVVGRIQKTPTLKEFAQRGNILDMVAGKGMYKIHQFAECLQAIAGEEIGKTLGEFAAEGKHFYTCAYDLTTRSVVHISSTSHPEVKVLDALLRTCALPYLFEPVIHNGHHYVDGGIINNMPVVDFLSAFPDLAPSDLVAMLIDKPDGMPSSHLWKWGGLGGILTLASRHFTLTEMEEIRPSINLHIVTSTLPFHDFSVTDSKTWEEFSKGYKLCESCTM